MGIASIVLGVVAFLFMLGGFVTTVVPVVGTLLSFGAPVAALAGIVTGGVAISRARRDGESSGLGVAGVVVNVVALIPAVIVAVTCGLCNAMCTAGMMMPRDGAAQKRWWMDAGTSGQPGSGPGAAVGAPDGGTAVDPNAPPPPGGWADGGAAEGAASDGAPSDGGSAARPGSQPDDTPAGGAAGAETKTKTKRAGGGGSAGR